MALVKVKNDLIPYKAGIVRVTPFDENFKPRYDLAYTTNREYLVSTQVTETRTTETLPNGNGQDGEFPTDQLFNLAVSMNTYDPKFNAMISGRKRVSAEELKPIINDTTITPVTGVGTAYEFTDAATYPVESEDGKFHFEIKDTYGNVFKDVSGEEEALGEANYKYESESHKLTFDTQYANVPLSCVYYMDGAKGEGYATPDTLKTDVFQIEVLGETQSASDNKIYKYYTKLTRASVSGDIAGPTTQKAKTSTLTYNFKSKPVPKGVSPFYESSTPLEDEAKGK